MCQTRLLQGKSKGRVRATGRQEVAVMDVQHADHPKLNPPVVFTGSAKKCKSGLPIGVIDIGVSQNAFLFRVALSGTKSDQSKVKCEIQCDGTVVIQGTVTKSTELLEGCLSKCQMKVQQMSSAGPLTISFKLPGPVDPRLVSPTFRPDGVLEVVVMRYRAPNDSADGWVPS